MASRASHPVVEEWLRSDDTLTAILERVAPTQPPSAPLKAMVQLGRSIFEPGVSEEALQLANAAYAHLPNDQSLTVLFLALWARVSWRTDRLAQSYALLQNARSRLSDRVPVEVKGVVRHAEGILASLEGNILRYEEILGELVAELPPRSPRRRFWFQILYQLLASQGKATELEDEMAHVENGLKDPERQATLRVLRFIHLVETGQLEAALALPPIVNDQAPSLRPFLGHYRARLVLLQFMAASSQRQFPVACAPEELPAWAVVMQDLLAKRPEQALEHARADVEPVPYVPHLYGFPSFNLIRGELACGHGDAARRLLLQRRERGRSHYLDNLFFARIELLGGRREAAARYFSALTESIGFHQAEGRLDFELQLSPELRPGDVMWLGREALRLSTGHLQGKPTAPPPELSPSGAPSFDPIVGVSDAIESVRADIMRFASLDISILITGETGTGKELVAGALHRQSPRHREPFLAINCGAIAESLLESELFGHERGAFTGAEKTRQGLLLEAGEGTLFLDEIGDIPQRLQTALLRVLETGEYRAVGGNRMRRVRCRIVSATNADLEKRSGTGLFRKDLLYRLQRLQIRLPPLRDRQQDIVPVAEHFLNKDRTPGLCATMSPLLQETFRSQAWPGNVRELRNEIERMRLMNSDKLHYDVADLSAPYRAAAAPSSARQAGRDRVLAPSQSDAPVARLATAMGTLVSGARSQEFQRLEALIYERKGALRRLDRLKDLFSHFGKLTRTEVIAALAISRGTATRDLQALCRERLIRKVKPTAAPRTHYFIRNADGEAQLQVPR